MVPKVRLRIYYYFKSELFWTSSCPDTAVTHIGNSEFTFSPENISKVKVDLHIPGAHTSKHKNFILYHDMNHIIY